MFSLRRNCKSVTLIAVMFIVFIVMFIVLPFRKKLIQVFEYRNDEWSSVVQIPLNEFIDLAAAEAIYHKA